MRIGNLELKNNIITAPMAGVTNRAYRDILREMGAGLVYSEMISAEALVRSNSRTLELLDMRGEPFPRAVQLLGSCAPVMKEAATIVREYGADIIDLNLGCPAGKVVRNGEGSRLLLEPEKAGALISEMAKAVDIPVTAKIRIGWDDTSINALEVAKIVEDSGARAITVHGRTRAQLYSGKADWQFIKTVKQKVKIPVIGNGDIFYPQDAAGMLQETGCDAVMIGRGMLGNPWLIKDCLEYLHCGSYQGRPGKEQILQMALSHLAMQVQISVYWHSQKYADQAKAVKEGELAAVRSMRGHLSWYIKGLRDAAHIREKLNHLEKKEDIEALFFTWLKNDGE